MSLRRTLRRLFRSDALRRRAGQGLLRRSRSVRFETLDVRNLMAADIPFGASTQDTAEFLLGRVAVTPVFLESNGETDAETQNWTEEEIDEVLAKLTDGIDWWSRALDKLDTQHSLDFIYDNRFATDPFETSYEAIDRNSNDILLPVSEFLIAQNVVDDSETSVGEAMFAFNHQQRLDLETDWSITVVVVDSSDDLDGSFGPGGFPRAFAYAGGLFMVVPSTRPAQVFAHEMGHLFWAVDEYPGGFSHNDSRGYYNTQADNAVTGAPAGFVQAPSIMANNALLSQAYVRETSPASTLAMVGWQDSDGDGIFDVLDVPLDFLATATFDPATRVAHLVGTARAVPLPNDNPDGLGHDITLARVGQLQYSVTRDGQAEPWVTVDEPNAAMASWDASVTIDDPFETIEWRVVEATTGISTTLTIASETSPAVSKHSLAGLAYYDANADSQRQADEIVLAATSVTLTNLDGSSVFGGDFSASDFAQGSLANSDTPGFRFESEVYLGDELIDQDRAGVTTSDVSDSLGFGYRVSGANSFSSAWGENERLRVDSDESVGQFTIRGFSRRDGARIRLEAFDVDGNRIRRVATEPMDDGQDFVVSVNDPEGQIRSIRVWTINGARFEINQVAAGPTTTVAASADGVWDIGGVVPGQYRLRAQAANMIYQEPVNTDDAGGFLLDVSTEQISAQAVGLVRVDSTRHNVQEPSDVDGNGSLSPADALIVINEIRRRGGSGLLAPTVESTWVDVNNDGIISPVDALTVINSIRRRNNGGSGEALPPDALSPPSSLNRVISLDWAISELGADQAAVGLSSHPGPSLGANPSDSGDIVIEIVPRQFAGGIDSRDSERSDFVPRMLSSKGSDDVDSAITSTAKVAETSLAPLEWRLSGSPFEANDR